MQGWLVQRSRKEVPVALAQFYASEEGLAWLHRQMLAAQSVFTLLVGANVHKTAVLL